MLKIAFCYQIHFWRKRESYTLIFSMNINNVFQAPFILSPDFPVSGETDMQFCDAFRGFSTKKGTQTLLWELPSVPCGQYIHQQSSVQKTTIPVDRYSDPFLKSPNLAFTLISPSAHHPPTPTFFFQGDSCKTRKWPILYHPIPLERANRRTFTGT